MTLLKEWMTLATTAEQNEMAELALTSREYLYQLSNGNRNANAATASRIETASKIMSKRSKKRLPVIRRSELCSVCAECPYAKGVL